MTNDSTRTVDGFEMAETFTNTLPFAYFMRRVIPLTVMLFLLTWLILALLLGMTGLPAVAWLALGLALIFIVVIVYVKKRQFDATWGTATLELSPDGAAEAVGKARSALAWGAVRGLTKQGMITPLQAVTPGSDFVGGNLVTGLAVDVGVAAARRDDQDALIGPGTLSLDRQASAILKAQFDQNMKQRQRDPETNRPIVAVLLTHYDPDWRTGRIGRWVRAYRPDLFA